MRYQLEALTTELLQELIPLFEAHYEEIAHPELKDLMKLDPDWEFYASAQDRGMLRIYTIRADKNKLIGYWVLFVNFHPHYKVVKMAASDVLFIHPSHRGVGKDFIPWVAKQLEMESVKILNCHVAKAHNFGPFLERLGYQQLEINYTLRLGNG